MQTGRHIGGKHARRAVHATRARRHRRRNEHTGSMRNAGEHIPSSSPVALILIGCWHHLPRRGTGEQVPLPVVMAACSACMRSSHLHCSACKYWRAAIVKHSLWHTLIVSGQCVAACNFELTFNCKHPIVDMFVMLTNKTCMCRVRFHPCRGVCVCTRGR
jgi:hypothetical protein